MKRPGVDWAKAHWLQALAHAAALMPLALLLWDYSRGGLGFDPIREATLRTGRYALTLLILSLACTPVYAVTGYKKVLRLRRPLGLYAFMYAGIHLLIFAWLDYGLDFGLLKEDIFNKKYALVGLAAFLTLLPLAITSTRGWTRRLGKNWKRLHRLAYAAALLAVAHFVWLVKADIRRPLLYGAVVALLLIARLPQVRPLLRWRAGQTETG